MPVCVNGHQTSATDWCDVCGIRITPPASTHGSRPASGASSSSASPVSPPPLSPSPPFGTEQFPDQNAGQHPGQPAGQHPGQQQPEQCPNCNTPREGAALYCEVCRYNFRTGVANPGPVAPPAPPRPPTGSPFPPYNREESPLSRPSQINRPAEPLPSESVTVTSGSGDFLLGPPSGRTAAPQPSPTVVTQGGAPAPVEGAPTAAEGPGATSWVAVVAADRAYFAAMMARSGPDAQGLYFPAYSPERELPLAGNQVTIGRRRHSTGEAPDIDLSRAPEDPGVSHQHAVLVQQPDGTWSVVDQDSTNGTTVNLAEDPIRPYTPVPLDEGDRVHVGAWTTITLKRA